MRKAFLNLHQTACCRNTIFDCLTWNYWHSSAKTADSVEQRIVVMMTQCKYDWRMAIDRYDGFHEHHVFCMEDQIAFKSKPDRCELYLLSIEEIIPTRDWSHSNTWLCRICLSEKTNAIIMCRGHLIYTEYGTSWFEEHCKCPHCMESSSKYCQFISYAYREMNQI